MTASEPTFSIRLINGNWHLVITTDGKEAVFPAGSELHANVMASLERTDHERKKAGLPPHRRV
jgi:hypothetical protein